MGIKPIETFYNGYRFRSRLEARWAVFFDAAGIKYQYEPEGFDLGDGIYYLPDFYLPDDEVWVEIKGSAPSDIECEKMLRFGQLVCGDMRVTGKRYRVLIGEIPYREEEIGDVIPCLIYESEEMMDDFLKSQGFPLKAPEYGTFIKGLWIHNRGLEKGRKALLAARQARFEHGETPSVKLA